MNRRTWTIIGATVALLGAATFLLAESQSAATVRIVEDVMDAPEAHQRGTFTLVGIPQPAIIPLTGADGTTMEVNPRFGNTTKHVTSWTRGGNLHHSTHIVQVVADGRDTQWTYTNQTRVAGDPAILEEQTAAWNWAGVQAFPVDAFDDGDGVTPRVWAVYGGVEPQPLQPKPSQFTGRLATHAPDGTPLPPGALIYQVDEYVAQCSSKFLPPEEQANQEARTAGPNA